MKKYIVVLGILFWLICFNKEVKAEDSIFNWETDTILIPYGGNLDEALENFKPTVTMKSGYYDPDFEVFYINHNYYMKSVISTNYIKTYQLYHKALSPKYNKTEIKLINIKIVDITNPVITKTSPYIFVLGEKKPDYLISLDYQDDVNQKEDIILKINDLDVNYKKVGNYSVIFTLTDLSGNQTIHKEQVKIIDVIPPEITFTELNSHIIGFPFNVETYVNVSDNHDTNLNITHKIIGTLDEPGSVILEVEVTDSSGNHTKSSKTITVELIDQDPPYVIFSLPYKIVVGTKKPDYTKTLMVGDNKTKSEDILVVVDESGIDYTKIGTYTVGFILSDMIGNTNTHHEVVEIIDNIAPSIHFKGKLIHPVGFMFDIKDYYDISDNYDTYLEINYSLLNDITMIGIVDIVITATDSSGNTSTATNQITVKDQVYPVINLSNKGITVEVFSEPINYLNFIEVSDNYDDLTVEDVIISAKVNYDLIGAYEVKFSLYDTSYNETSVVMNVYVQDKTPPMITANTIYSIKNEPINLFEGLIISDNYSLNDEISLSIFETSYLEGEIGTFYVIYQAVDKSGNHQYFTRSIVVEGLNQNQLIYYLVGGLLVVCGVILGGVYFLKKRKMLIKV